MTKTKNLVPPTTMDKLLALTPIPVIGEEAMYKCVPSFLTPEIRDASTSLEMGGYTAMARVAVYACWVPVATKLMEYL